MVYEHWVLIIYPHNYSKYLYMFRNSLSTSDFLPLLFLSSVPRGLQLSIQGNPPWDGATSEAGQVSGPHTTGPQGRAWSPGLKWSYSPTIPCDSSISTDEKHENTLLHQTAPHRHQETSGETVKSQAMTKTGERREAAKSRTSRNTDTSNYSFS